MNDVLNNVLESSPLLVLVVALNALGLVLKAWNWHSDRFIPTTLALAGIIAGVMLGDTFNIEWVQKCKNVPFAQGMVGLIAGVFAVFGHQVVSQITKKKEP